MKTKTTHRQNALFIAAFAFATCLASAASVWYAFPNQFLMLLIAPILIAAFLRRRYVYITMLTVLFASAMIVTDNFRWPITESTVTVIATVLTTVVACETVRYSARRQRRLWRRIAESEHRLRAVLDNARDAVFTIDENGQIADVNEAATGILGYTHDELIGSDFTRLVAEGASQPFQLEDESNANWSGNLVTKSGAPAPVEITVGHARHRPRATHIAVVRDQAERDKAEARIRHEQAIRESILESSPDHLIMLDLDYRVKFINRSVPELPLQDILGQVILDLLPQDRVESARTVYENVRKTGQPGMFEAEYISEDQGSTRYFENRVAPIIEDGHVDGFIVSASDVTARKHVEMERAALERHALRSQKLESLGLLAGGVAHDFNNLLVAILSRADLARGDVHDAGKIEAHLRQIVEASEHAAALCRQLLAYSGKGKFAIAPIALNDQLIESKKLLQISMPENVHLDVELTPAPATVEADATQLKQVLMNLIRNAADAMQPAGGTVRIRTGVQSLDDTERALLINGNNINEGEFVYLEVADTGSGMTSETMERLFDPFHTTKSDGTGLGMAAVLGIVRGHGGAMSVTSKEGSGTTIRVLFPASAKPLPDSPFARGTNRAPHGNGGLVLVVDDEAAVRKVAQRILERADFEVMAVDSGVDAVEAVKSRGSEIAAMLLDMKMPDMNGEEVMERVRALRPGLPILLSSGYSETEVKQRSKGKGVSAVLPKPYRAQELVDAINDIVLAAQLQ